MRLPCNIVKLPDGTWKCLTCERRKGAPLSLLPRCPTWLAQTAQVEKAEPRG